MRHASATETTTVYGIRRTWPDGHVEHEDCDSRHDASVRTRPAPPDHASDVVIRTVTDTGWVAYRTDAFIEDATLLRGADVRWGCRITWPDGHTEVRTSGRGVFAGRPYQRRDAEHKVADLKEGTDPGLPQVTAELVYRMRQHGDWQPLNEPDFATAYADAVAGNLT